MQRQKCAAPRTVDIGLKVIFNTWWWRLTVAQPALLHGKAAERMTLVLLHQAAVCHAIASQQRSSEQPSWQDTGEILACSLF